MAIFLHSLLFSMLVSLLFAGGVSAKLAQQELPSALQTQADLQTRAEYIMGTVFKITLENASPAHFAGAFKILRAHDEVLSDYDPHSELSRVTPLARRDWTPVSPILCRALVQSRYYGLLSQGAFDISIRPLVALWGFKDGQFGVPSAPAIAHARLATGWHQIGLRQQQTGCSLRLWHPDSELDFGGIGKGLALDAAADWLRSQGLTRVALDAGGSSMRFIGAPSTSPRGWPVQLRGQRDPSLWLRNSALASSDHGEQFFEHAGQRYGHILDPRTAWPVPAREGVTVLSASATSADALSTALMVLPTAQGDRLANLLAAEVIRREVVF